MALITNVCRLCLVTEDLVWVFDRKMPGIQNNSLKDIIFATSGVEIYQKDMISQKICSKCCQISMKMFQFREQSLKNDKILKNQYAELLKNAKIKLKIPNTDITITAEKVEAKKEETKKEETKKGETKKDETKKEETRKELKNDTSNARYRIHPSVTALFKDNPQMRLPSVCLKSNIAPCVSLEMDAVEKYFRNRRLSIEKCSQLALKSTRKVAKKKGSAKPISKQKIFEVPKISSVSSSKSVDPLQIVSTRANVKLGSTKGNTDNLLPINMKTNPETSYKIVNVSKIVAQDKSKSSDDSDTSIRRKPLGLKRKLSTDESSTELETKKPAFIESLGLSPKSKPNGDSTGTLYVDNNKSVPLFICDICNSVQYNARDLKRHKLKHLRCQFCKMKFRSLDEKGNHIEKYCRIKNMMNNLPAVELEKIEFKLKVRREYPEAFYRFSPLPGLELEEKNDSDNVNDEESTSVQLEEKDDSENNLNEERSTSVESIQKTTENPIPKSLDVIEIISDDEDSTPPLASELSTAVGETLIGSSKEKECLTGVSSALSRYPSSPATIHNSGTKILNKTPAASIVNTQTVPTKIPVPNTTSLPTSSTRNLSESIIPRKPVAVALQKNAVVDLEQNTPSCVVKPDIVIKNVSILDKFDPKATDTNVVKYLLTQLGQLQSDGTSQTELPSTDSIIVNKGSRTIELKNLRYLLLMYKIPVQINKGDFKISYTYEAPALREKKLCLWNDLMAIDLKVTNDNVDAVSSRTATSSIPNSERTTTAAGSLNSNSGVTIPQPPNTTTQIVTVITSSQNNTNVSGASEIDSLNTRNTIISPSAPCVMSCIQTPTFPYTPNGTSITSDPGTVDSVNADAGNAAFSTPVSSEVSDTQTPSISFSTNSTNTSGPPVFPINTMGNDAGHVTVVSPISSGMSCVQPQPISLNPNSSSILSPPAFFINTINNGTENAVISNPNLSGISCIQPQNSSFDTNRHSSISSPSAFSINNINAIAGNSTSGSSISPVIGCILPSSSISEMSCIQPSNISFHSNSSSISSPSTFSINNVNAMAGRTTTGTSITSGIGCIVPSSSISFSFPTTTSVHQIAPTSVNTVCILSNAVTNTHSNFYSSCENSTAVDVPITVPDDLPNSASSTPISAPLTLVSVPLMPVSATLDSSPALPSNVFPSATVTEANSISVVNNSVPVTGRVGIRVKNLCELT